MNTDRPRANRIRHISEIVEEVHVEMLMQRFGVRRGSDLEELFAFQLCVAKLPAPVREFRFAPPRRWRFDFAWPDRLIAMEIDGGTWTAGRHARGAGIAGDCEKACAAAVAGFRVLRATGDMVRNGTALEWVLRALDGQP